MKKKMLRSVDKIKKRKEPYEVDEEEEALRRKIGRSLSKTKRKKC